MDWISLITRLPRELSSNLHKLEWICSDPFSRTFGIQGENSMKSRRNSWSIQLQSLRNRVLTRGDHDELRIFLEIRLIPSRIDQKFKNKRGEMYAFKEGIRPEIVAIGSGRGRRLKALWERVFGCGIVASILRKIYLDLPSIWSQGDPDFRRDFRHDRATIGPRSASIMMLELRRSLDDRRETNPRRSRAIISSIAARSRRDRGVLPRSSIAVRLCSNEWTIAINWSYAPRSRCRSAVRWIVRRMNG